MIHLKNVVKEFRLGTNTIRTLDGLNLEVGSQKFTAIIGPSGSGKTTLLAIMGALDRPTSGEVVIAGTNLQNLDEKELVAYRRDNVGFIFQAFNLIPNLTALENVMVPMEFKRKLSRDEMEKRAKALLELVGMSHRIAHTPGKLSGGEQQRVAIARALANDPPLVLADEPTGNLDSETGKQIIELLKELNQKEKKTIVIVTHSTAAQEIADNVYTIRDGKIINR